MILGSGIRTHGNAHSYVGLSLRSTSSRGILPGRKRKQPFSQGHRSGNRPQLGVNAEKAQSSETPKVVSADKSAEIVYTAVQQFIRRHAGARALPLYTTERLQEIRSTLSVHLDSILALEDSTGDLLSRDVALRLTLVGHNCRTAIITIDGLLDLGFSTRLSTYDLGPSPRAVFGRNFALEGGWGTPPTAAGQEMALYPLRPSPVYLSIGPRTSQKLSISLADLELDEDGFTAEADLISVSDASTEVLKKGASVLSHLGALLAVKQAVVDEGEPLKSVADAANFTKDRAAQLAVLFYPIPTAAQLADAEHCLEVWGRLREHHLGLSERVAKRFQPGPVIRGGQWIADNSLKAGSAMMAKSFGSCRENLERLLRLEELASTLLANGGLVMPGEGAAPPAQPSEPSLPRPPPVDRASLTPDQRVDLAVTELGVYLGQYMPEGEKWTVGSVEQLSTQDLKTIQKDIPPMLAEFQEARKGSSWRTAATAWLLEAALGGTIMSDINEELKAREKGKVEPTTASRRRAPSQAGTTSAPSASTSTSSATSAAPGVKGNLNSRVTAGAGAEGSGRPAASAGESPASTSTSEAGGTGTPPPPTEGQLAEWYDPNVAPLTQQDLDRQAALTAAGLALIFAGVGGCLAQLWGVDAFSQWGGPRGATGWVDAVGTVLTWTAPFALGTGLAAVIRQKMDDGALSAEELAAVEAGAPSLTTKKRSSSDGSSASDAAQAVAPAAAAAAAMAVAAGAAATTAEVRPGSPSSSDPASYSPSSSAPEEPRSLFIVPTTNVAPSVGGEVVNLTAGELVYALGPVDEIHPEELPARIGPTASLAFYATTAAAETLLFRGAVLGTVLLTARFGSPFPASPEVITYDPNLMESVLSKLLGSLVPVGAPSHPTPLPLLFPFLALATAGIELTLWRLVSKWSGSEEVDLRGASTRLETLFAQYSEDTELAVESFQARGLKDVSWINSMISWGIPEVVEPLAEAIPNSEPKTWEQTAKAVADRTSARSLEIVARQLAVDLSSASRRRTWDAVHVLVAGCYLSVEVLMTGSLMAAFATQMAGNVAALVVSGNRVSRFRAALEVREKKETAEWKDRIKKENEKDRGF